MVESERPDTEIPGPFPTVGRLAAVATRAAGMRVAGSGEGGFCTAGNLWGVGSRSAWVSNWGGGGCSDLQRVGKEGVLCVAEPDSVSLSSSLSY